MISNLNKILELQEHTALHVKAATNPYMQKTLNGKRWKTCVNYELVSLTGNLNIQWKKPQQTDF